MTEPLACGHQEPPDGARVLYFGTPMPDGVRWKIRLRFCTDCALLIETALANGRWWAWGKEQPWRPRR